VHKLISQYVRYKNEVNQEVCAYISEDYFVVSLRSTPRSDALKSAGWLGIRAGWLIFALFVLDSVAGGSATPGSLAVRLDLSSAESPQISQIQCIRTGRDSEK